MPRSKYGSSSCAWLSSPTRTEGIVMPAEISMEIQIRPIDKLVFYARNPRKNDAAVDRLLSDGAVIDRQSTRDEGFIFNRKRLHGLFPFAAVTAVTASITPPVGPRKRTLRVRRSGAGRARGRRPQMSAGVPGW